MKVMFGWCYWERFIARCRQGWEHTAVPKKELMMRLFRELIFFINLSRFTTRVNRRGSEEIDNS